MNPFSPSPLCVQELVRGCSRSVIFPSFPPQPVLSPWTRRSSRVSSHLQTLFLLSCRVRCKPGAQIQLLLLRFLFEEPFCTRAIDKYVFFSQSYRPDGTFLKWRAVRRFFHFSGLIPSLKIYSFLFFPPLFTISSVSSPLPVISRLPPITQSIATSRFSSRDPLFPPPSLSSIARRSLSAST